jgi:hypothetical protein
MLNRCLCPAGHALTQYSCPFFCLHNIIAAATYSWPQGNCCICTPAGFSRSAAGPSSRLQLHPGRMVDDLLLLLLCVWVAASTAAPR